MRKINLIWTLFLGLAVVACNDDDERPAPVGGGGGGGTTGAINGTLDTTEGYTRIGMYGPGKDSTGFGAWGGLELWAKQNSTTVTLFVVGTCEANGNNFVLYLGSSGVAGGIAAGTALPRADDPQGPFAPDPDPDPADQALFAAPTLDFECDMAIRIAASGDNYFMSAVNYAAPVNGSRIDVFLGQHLYDVTKTVTQDRKTINMVQQPQVTTFNGIRTAYSHTVDLNGNTSLNKGWEIEIPRSAIGLTGSGELKILFAYISGSGDFFSANTIPAKPGNGSNNLGRSPIISDPSGEVHLDYDLN